MKLYITKSDTNTQKKKIALDDMILTKDMATSAGSKMLDSYMSLFDAEVVTKLKQNGYEIEGKTNVGEFGIDLIGETSNFGMCIDDKNKILNPAAEIIKSKDVEAVVCVDSNGWPRRAAAMNNLVYLKPTYGAVSRYGIIQTVSSSETVGVLANDTKTCKEVLSVISGYDEKDGTSLAQEKCDLVNDNANAKEIKRIAIFTSMIDSVDEKAKDKIKKFISDAKEKEIEIVEIKEDLDCAKTAWNILMSAEFCNNVSKYDGVKYGYRSNDYKNIYELYTNSRTESFGSLTKSIILSGSNALSTDNYTNLYDRSLKIRRVVSNYMNELLADFDAVIMPACSKLEFTKEDIENNSYIAFDENLYTAVSSLTGLPTVVVSGMQVVGKFFSEASLLAFAEKFEDGGAM